jgi:hypothetical protein
MAGAGAQVGLTGCSGLFTLLAARSAALRHAELLQHEGVAFGG